MLDFIELGSAPFEEECAQLGEPDYKSNAKKECWEYRRQLQRMFPDENSILFQLRKLNDGSHQVVAVYDSTNVEAIDSADHIETNRPARWDEEAARIMKIAREMRDA